MKSTRVILFPVVTLFSTLLLSGCLIASKKVVLFEVAPDGSGTGRIIYTDISSLKEDQHDRTLEDYTSLVSDWYHGDEIEDRYRGVLNAQKRLFELGGALHGETTFTFEHYNDVGLYRHDETGPWMYYALRHTSNVEGFDSTNGTYGGDLMPVIFWPAETTSFRIVNRFDPGEGKVSSLLPLYKRIGVEPVVPSNPE